MTENMNGMGLTLDSIRKAAEKIRPYIRHTPTVRWQGREVSAIMGAGTEIYLKMELFQHSGTFKARGALSNMLELSAEQRERGVTAMSAGNHAIAVAFAAQALGINAKVVMQSSANPLRIEAARAFGAEVIIAQDGPTGFALAEKISRDEGRAFIHPFDGPLTALGTAGVGLEMFEEAGPMDAMIVSVGGGGLAGGACSAIKVLDPGCRTYGVEPEGADSMHRSFASGKPETITPSTIADSLAPPMSLAYGVGLCRKNLDQLVRVSDDDMCRAMALLFRDMKLAVEPACAAATAAMTGPLREELRGKRVGVVLCGSNIDNQTFCSLLKRGHL